MKNEIEQILKSKLGKENVKYLEVRYWNECQGRTDSGYDKSEIKKGRDGELYAGNTHVSKNYVFELNLEAAGFEESGHFSGKSGIIQMGFEDKNHTICFIDDLELIN